MATLHSSEYWKVFQCSKAIRYGSSNEGGRWRENFGEGVLGKMTVKNDCYTDRDLVGNGMVLRQSCRLIRVATMTAMTVKIDWGTN